jgi:putative ABC transport system permease protein
MTTPGMPAQAKRTTVALRETLWLALDTLRAHKLRSFLTLLGVILAVTTLVAVMSVVEGLNLYVSDKIANLGSDAFVLDRFGIITNLEEFNKARKRPPLSLEDYEALRDRMRLAAHVGAVEATIADVRYANNLIEDVSIQGVTANYGQIRNFEVDAGRFITGSDDFHRGPVCFIGNDLVQKFFPGVDPIGKEIRAGSQQYQIVGIAKVRGSVFGQTQDNFVMVPLGTYRKSWHAPDNSLSIFIQARGTEWMAAAQDEARVIIRSLRHSSYDAPDSFGIIASSSITGLWESLTGNLFGIAVWLTSVFLVVGGIVIMNIMLASVTERTREIGLRKSLGARRKHIVLQFLVESAVLAGVGGIAGIALAVGIGEIVRLTTPIPSSTPLRAVFTALALSTIVGLFFGIYPAMRAAKLDPIEALRAEA